MLCEQLGCNSYTDGVSSLCTQHQPQPSERLIFPKEKLLTDLFGGQPQAQEVVLPVGKGATPVDTAVPPIPAADGAVIKGKGKL
jgi:hypothetical protein